MRRKRWAATIAAVFGLATPAGAATTGEELQAALEKVVAEHQLVPGASAYVDAPRAGLPWTGAAGRFAEGSTRRLSPEDPFRIASVQKVFTAAAILRLVEDGRLELDQAVAPYLDTDQVDRMHVHEGVNHGRQITIRQLLNHTSGLNSHDQCDEYTLAVGTGPRRRWTPREQIEMMIDCGDPHFPPGEEGKAQYSDTGFVMLGTVLAKTTGRSYAGALRALLPLEKLGVTHTWHELLEPERAEARPRAHQYFGPADLTNWDPSFDSWGGGGYVSTVQDLGLFMRALFEGRVFRKRATLGTMLSAVPVTGAADKATAYGLGIGVHELSGERCLGHPGVWSSFMLYCPSLDLAFALTTNQASDEHMHHTERPLAEDIVAAVKRAAVMRPRLRIEPSRLRRGRASHVTLTFTAGERPVGGASARLAARRKKTDAGGRAGFVVRFKRAGLKTARACKVGVGCATARLRVSAA